MAFDVTCSISDGDVLLCAAWLVACRFSLNEPELHLNFGIELLHGADFVRWWAQKMLRDPELRNNIPLDADVGEQLEYFGRTSS